MKQELKWWQTAVFYQIYPRSFADGNGDGIGDLKGMIGKLDYLKYLGVDAVWLSPHFPSPNIDCGYDIADYQNVAPEYGTLEEFKHFLDGLHERGMRLVLDLVLNHTSDKHPWFEESRSSLDNPKRDWYIWKKSRGGNPPTNWYSTFGGSAWELDPETGEYYYHFFFKEQPDLNWHKPEVKQAMFDAARFWLEMGVDGFRLDAIGTLFEDERYLDQLSAHSQSDLLRLENSDADSNEMAEIRDAWEEVFKYQHDLPEVHEVMRELRKVVDEYPDRVLIGETDDIAFYGNGSDELHLNFNFPLMRTRRITAQHVCVNQKERLGALPAGAWPCNTLGNHDSSRMLNNFGDGENNEKIARLNLLLLLTLKGTPFLYNGEEIGMSDFICADKKTFQDSLALWIYQLQKEVIGQDEVIAVARAAEHSRDKCRTPFQWSGRTNAGFAPAGVRTWLPVNPDYQNGINLADEFGDPNSLWRYYQSLLHFRKTRPELTSGEYEEIATINEDVFGFKRMVGPQEVILLLNFSESSKSEAGFEKYSPLFTSTSGTVVIERGQVTLGPFSGIVLAARQVADTREIDRIKL